MYLIQCFLPLYDNEKNAFPLPMYAAESRTLKDRYGGVTVYARAPASGLWENGASRTTQDEFVIYEVMAENLDTMWWRHYRRELEERFRQDRILIRAHAIELL